MSHVTTNENAVGKERMKAFCTADIVRMALFAAILCVLAPLSVPIGPVPISLATLVLYFSVYFLDWKKATVSCVVYLLLGIVGLPVFSGFGGGIGKLVGPTGGYLAGYIFVTITAGIFIEKFDNILLQAVGLILGTAILYTLGTAWFCISTGTGIGAALATCVFPFVPGDLVKVIVTLLIAPAASKQIKKAS